MTICILKTDHPIRVQFGHGLVIHAAREQKCGGFNRYVYDNDSRLTKVEYVPPTTRIYVACSYCKVEERHIVANNSAITCKQCSKRLGLDKVKASPERYVVVNTETGEFYKNSRHCSNWIDDILDATLYKVKGVAEKLTTQRYYVNGDGNEVTFSEYLKLRGKDKGAAERRRKNPNRNMRTVTITVD